MTSRRHDESEPIGHSGSRRCQPGYGYYSDNEIPKGRLSENRRPSPPGGRYQPRARSIGPVGEDPSHTYRAPSTSRTYRVPSPPRTSRSPHRYHQDEASTVTRPAASPPSPGRRRLSLQHIRAPQTGQSGTPLHSPTYLAPPGQVLLDATPGRQPVPILVLPRAATPASTPPTFSTQSQGAVPMIKLVTDSSDVQSSSSTTGVLGSKLYQYNPLRPSEIRLIRLHPARSWIIKCDIFHFPLGEAPSYTAISYAWGDVGHEHGIELHGITVPVTVSLHGALRALRERGGRHVWVWADALCIDQQNGDEKRNQLRLMTDIYKKAQSVAIWLGPEKDHSELATQFLEEVVARAHRQDHFDYIFPSLRDRWQEIEAVISLFERNYWDRLWVVQEIFNAKIIMVYCGSTKLPWSVYEEASRKFLKYKSAIESRFPGGTNAGRPGMGSHKQLSHSQVLAYEGPNSLLDRAFLEEINILEEGPDNMLFQALLDVMRRYRRKLSGDPKDKVFGILGVLPERIRREIRADYSLSVKDVYTNVVDILIHTTNRLDVICECIHFPRHDSSANLQSWVPDWSYMPEVGALGASYDFSADGRVKQAICGFEGRQRNKLRISAVYLDRVKKHEIAVGTLCRSADYLMAFLHWRAMVLENFRRDDREGRTRALEDFCRTLCLGHVPTGKENPRDLVEYCHHIFAFLIDERLPELALDRDLASCITSEVDLGGSTRRESLQKYFGSRMMGRCFCITIQGLMGLGSGFMTVDDLIVVPFGCSTPVILRPEGDEFRFVGDVYIRGYMSGKAVEEFDNGERELGQYVLH